MPRHFLTRTTLILTVLFATFLGTPSVNATTLLTTIPVNGARPDAAAVDNIHQRVYVTAEDPNTLFVIDAQTDTILSSIPLGSLGFGVAVHSGMQRVYLANYFTNTVSVLDATTNSFIATISGHFSQPQLITVNEATNRVYVTNDKGGGQLNPSYVTVIDATTNAIVDTIPVGSSPHGVAVNPLTNRVYVTAAGNDPGLTVVDGATDTIIATVPLSVSVSQVAIDISLNRIYVADAFGNRVFVIDGTSNTVITSIPLDTSYNLFPTGLAVDSVRHRAYVGDQSDLGGFGTVVSVIDTAADTLLEQVRVGSNALPNLIAVDPDLAKVYVPLANARTVAVIGPETPVNRPPKITAASAGPINEGDSAVISVTATDPDDDPLTYRLDCDNSGSFETAGLTCSGSYFPDNGTQTVIVQVDDGHGSTATASMSIVVNNVAPSVGSITAPLDPVPVNTAINTSASFSDPGILDTHTVVWNWGDTSFSSCPGNTSSCSLAESNGAGTVTGSHTYTSAGVYPVTLTITDNTGGTKTQTFQYISVYNATPQGLFSAGQKYTSPAGALAQNVNASGLVMFGLSYKYQGTVPTGNRQFSMDYNQANFHFNATSISSLVIANGIGTLRGTGTLNGSGSYAFLVVGNEDTNSIRIQIKDMSGAVLYDTEPKLNGATAPDTTNPTTVVTAGNILVH